MAPSKMFSSCCSKSLFFSCFSISEYSMFLCISRSISTFHEPTKPFGGVYKLMNLSYTSNMTLLKDKSGECMINARKQIYQNIKH